MNSLEQNFAKDISNLHLMVNWASNILLTGSRSQRRPDLGKMVTLPCGHRRLQGAPACCNMKPATTQRAWDPEKGFHQVECEPRENEAMFSKKFIKRFRHKRHGQSRTNALRALTLRFMDSEELLKDAAFEMHVKIPDRASLPSFCQKYFLWSEDREQKRIRRQRDVSRRINADLATVGSRGELGNIRSMPKKKEENHGTDPVV